MGDQLRALIEPLNTIECYDGQRGFRRAFKLPPDAKSFFFLKKTLVVFSKRKICRVTIRKQRQTEKKHQSGV